MTTAPANNADLFGNLLPAFSVERADDAVPQNIWLVGQTRSRDQRAGRYRDRVLHTQKMVPELCRRMLGHLKAASGSVILDPFLGIGTTAVECNAAGLVCYGSDIMPEYVQEARSNLELAKERDGRVMEHRVQVADAIRLPWDDAVADACVTSPPYGDCDPVTDSNGRTIQERAQDGNGYAKYVLATGGLHAERSGIRGSLGFYGRAAWEAAMFLCLIEIRRVLKPGAFCMIACREYWHRKGKFDMIDLPGRICDMARGAGMVPYDMVYAVDSSIDSYGVMRTRASVHNITLARKMAERPCPRGVPGVTRVLVLRRRDRKAKGDE